MSCDLILAMGTGQCNAHLMGGARWCGKDADVQEVCNHCAACPLTCLLGGCLAVDGRGGKVKSRRGKRLKNLNRGGKKLKNLNQGGEGDGRGGAQRPPVRKCTEWASGPPGLH